MGACHRQFCARPGFKSRLNQYFACDAMSCFDLVAGWACDRLYCTTHSGPDVSSHMGVSGRTILCTCQRLFVCNHIAFDRLHIPNTFPPRFSCNIKKQKQSRKSYFSKNKTKTAKKQHQLLHPPITRLLMI